jgi:hypothetical protein
MVGVAGVRVPYLDLGEKRTAVVVLRDEGVKEAANRHKHDLPALLSHIRFSSLRQAGHAKSC